MGKDEWCAASAAVGSEAVAVLTVVPLRASRSEVNCSLGIGEALIAVAYGIAGVRSYF